jgi:hypothetical protein
MGCYCVTHITKIWLDGLWKSQLLVDPQNMIDETDRGTEILRSNMDLFQEWSSEIMPERLINNYLPWSKPWHVFSTKGDGHQSIHGVFMGFPDTLRCSSQWILNDGGMTILIIDEYIYMIISLSSFDHAPYSIATRWFPRFKLVIVPSNYKCYNIRKPHRQPSDKLT